MFCPKCGSEAEDGTNTCLNCGLKFDSIYQEKTNKVLSDNVSQRNNVTTGVVIQNLIFKIIFWGLAVVVLVMFFMAASSISKGGTEIMQIRSVGGETLEEAYYEQLGNIYSGLAMVSRALGIFFASVLVRLGFKK